MILGKISGNKIKIRNSDIRLINGDVATICRRIKEYLSNENFNLDHEELKENYADIKSSNLQRSVFKLYFQNDPQIVHWHLTQKPGNQVQVEIKSDLFPQFRIFYFVTIGFLLLGFSLYYASTSMFKYESVNLLQQFGLLSTSNFNSLLAVSFLVLAFIFCIKLVNTAPYEAFLNRFYKKLRQKSFENEIVLQNDFGFPDLLKILLLFIVFILIVLLFSELKISYINDHLPFYSFLGGAIFTLVILLILVLIMICSSSIATRVIFVLTGIGLCIPVAIYSNAPVVLSYPGDIKQQFENHFGIGNITDYGAEAFKYLNEEIYKKTKYFAQKASIFFVSGCALLFLLASILFINNLFLPIRLVKHLKRFLSPQPDSDYHHALYPGNSSYLFNLIIVLLWAIIGTANILGLYFSFSIFERAFLTTNSMFESELAIMFYTNTQMTFAALLQSKFSSDLTVLIHRMGMLMYSIPVIGIFILALKKNLKSTLEGYFLLKDRSGKYERIENDLTEKIGTMCKFKDIRVPIVRMVDSQDINAETKYLGFPVFKNILVVTTGAWDELHANGDELDALLAHEVEHIKKHTFTRRFLCLLSDYSLFGNGFLAVLQNSFQLEKDADDFAVRWLENKHRGKNRALISLRSLLERIEESQWKSLLLKSTNDLNFPTVKDDLYRNRFLDAYHDAPIIQKIKINLKLLYQLYFSNEIISYFHPSIDQRIAWVEEKYGAIETN